MSNGVDRLIAYRTMRAVQEQDEMAKNTGRGSVAGSTGPGVGQFPEAKSHGGSFKTKPTRWQRWQAFVYRHADKLL